MTFTLMIERRYSNSPNSGGWWPAFECDTREEADELLAEYPLVYGEVSRQIIEHAPSRDVVELRPC